MHDEAVSNSLEQKPFSVTDLLCVIAIVTLLCGILVPVFAQARAGAAGGCLANRRLISEAVSLYSQDNDGLRAPNPYLLTYQPYIQTGRLYPCPVFGAAGIVGHLVAKDHLKGAGGGRGSHTNLQYHGGPIMPLNHTYSIFWGSSWPTYSGDKITKMDSWYQGFGGSAYANTNTEYSQSDGTFVGTTSNFGGHAIDGSLAPRGAPSTQTILNEVCAVAGSKLDTTGLGFYAVYSDQPRGSAGYCAWHSSGFCGGVPVQFAFFFNLDGDPGCDPQSSVSGESQGLKALANVTGHELSEAMTDPQLNAWYDRQGSENADKCAWTFGAPFVTFKNGTQWKIQGNWSNAAANINSGYANGGCIQTK